MKRFALLMLAGVLASWIASSGDANAANKRRWDRVAAAHAQGMPWHGPYANRAWGGPLPLVVPPTAHMQTNWGWGVSQDTMTPIYHQFHRRMPNSVSTGYPFQNTPRWPSHTSQFGVYYLRGPW